MATISFGFAILVLILCISCTFASPSKKQLIDASSPTVAFFAERSTDATLTDGSVLILDRTRINEGGLYYNHSGNFFCHDNGLYAFFWSTRKPKGAPAGYRCLLKLRMNGHDVKHGPKTSFYSTAYATGSVQAGTILRCQPHKTVTLFAEMTGKDKTATFNNLQTTFSGFRLDSEVAFNAELSTKTLKFPGDRIFFDRVIYNIGYAYDVTNGAFTCPDYGTYLFHISLLTTEPNNQWSACRLVQERRIKGVGPITYRATGAYDSGTADASTILTCKKGDRIYVESHNVHTFKYNGFADKFTSFTGFKLYDEDNVAAVAFTAVLTYDFKVEETNSTIRFDRIMANIGEAYDDLSGHFICPDDALYMFTWSVVADYDSADAEVYLTMDGYYQTSSQFNFIPSSVATGTTGTASQSYMVRCRTQSYVRLNIYKKNKTARKLLGQYTSFTGYRLPVKEVF